MDNRVEDNSEELEEVVWVENNRVERELVVVKDKRVVRRWGQSFVS